VAAPKTDMAKLEKDAEERQERNEQMAEVEKTEKETVNIDGKMDKELEGQESAEVRRSTGFITDAAMNLLEQGDFIEPGGGIDKVENRLNISGNPEKMNYTAIGGTLYIEAVNADGSAQKFAVVPTGGRSIVDKFKAMFKKGEGKNETKAPQSTEKINPIATYATTRVDTFYTKSPEHLSIADDSIKTGGKLPELLREANRRNIVIEQTENNVESDIVAKIDGEVVAKTTESINDRDQWENGIARMLEEAIQKQDESKEEKKT